MKNQHLKKKNSNSFLHGSNKALIQIVVYSFVTTFFLPLQIATGISLPQSTTAELSTNKSYNSSDKNSPKYLAQSNPLYGCLRLTYSVLGIVYESVLQMNGYEGIMITQYFEPNIGRTAYVQQTMRMRSSPRGIVILGYDPVYPGTNRKHPTYIPDNFFFQVRPNGDYIFALMDDAGQLSPVEVNQCARR
ncbi:MAG: hypothetical protein F6K40_35720 [Okeania sp. SIO3I5]|uniref:hypothetical protein n=1 Tax=Okeania sp. SIO3I5 TaxID=2607805 RepID=UPI0013B789C5|nr:hypothetical protein [Okeania sp. SIO3I5]NEQ41262.1 hypothetical protein [Okeania sp. SIO3I5]